MSVSVTHLTSLGTLDCLPIYHTLLIQAGDDVGALLRGDGSDVHSRVLISMLRLSLAVPPKALELLCFVFAGTCPVVCVWGSCLCPLLLLCSACAAASLQHVSANIRIPFLPLFTHPRGYQGWVPTLLSAAWLTCDESSAGTLTIDRRGLFLCSPSCQQHGREGHGLIEGKAAWNYATQPCCLSGTSRACVYCPVAVLWARRLCMLNNQKWHPKRSVYQ